MTKKSIEKREPEVVQQKSKIELFCETYESEATRKVYLSSLKQIERSLDKSIDSCTEKELWDIVENRTDIKESTKRKNQFRIKSYLKYYNLPCKLFTNNLVKENINGEWVYPNLVKKEPEGSLKKELPKLELIKEKTKGIKELINKLLFNLLTNYKQVLRCDLANVKVKNYKPEEPHINFKTNTIIFPELNKTKMSVNIELNKEDSEILNRLTFDSDYFLDIGGAIENRCNNYTKLIKRLTKEYFNESITQTDFRHLATTQSFKANEHLPVKEKHKQIEIDCRLRGHTSKEARAYYLEDTGDINVSLKYKKTLNILGDDDKILKSIDLKDLVKILEFMDLLKKF
jgi:hypothetical protein